MTDLERFRATLDDATPPGINPLLQGLWWDAKDDWNKAHELAQADNTPLGAAVHAYLHRKEPDLANARYWYARAGRPPATVTLQQEWDSLVTELLRLP